MIQVNNFNKVYRETIAVSDLSFQVAEGQVLGLVGPNGAGKTTTLRAIAGIIPPTRGQLIIAGYDIVVQAVEAKKQFAYIPDEPRLFDTLTVVEHMRFVAAAYGVAGHEEKGEQLLQTFELTEKRNALGQELSRGMRQKVAICCGYLHEPRAILFDEPLTGLDPRGIRTLKQSIRERALSGTAIMISSHLLSLVEDLCSHLLILDRGRSRFFGPIEEARIAFDGLAADANLEEVFFRAIDKAGGDDGSHRASS
jgi:ABC-2 type transport system ATP-binding protein